MTDEHTVTSVTPSHRIAVVARFAGPTNTRPSRIHVWRADAARLADESRITVTWDHGLSTEDNYAAAILTYLVAHDWAGRWVVGATTDGYVAVYAGKEET